MAKEQWEEETIERFMEYLCRERGVTFAISGRDVVIDSTTNENFDYQLTSSTDTKVAVEIFRLVESGQDLAQGKVWSQVAALLKQVLARQDIKGYLILLPHNLNIPLREVDNYVHKAAATITDAIKNNAGVDKFTIDGMSFRRIDRYESISFGWGGGARSINPVGTAGAVFQSKLEKKNKQIGILDHERILLVVNWAIIVDEGDVVRALASINFDLYPNVDRIYFEERNQQFVQVYERSIHEAILNKTGRTVGDLRLLLQYLKHKLVKKNKAAYDFVKAETQQAGSNAWLSDDAIKENLVVYAQGLAEEGQIDEALWVIRQLRYDLDPDPDGQNSPDDPSGEYNYHRRILEGEEASSLTTVRGHLCGLISRVIVNNKPEYYAELIDILDQYLSEKNLYIRAQALFPLTQLAMRIQAVKNQDGSPFQWDQASRERVRALAFRTLTQNTQYPRVLQVLLHLFHHMRGLDESEAKKVLETFIEAKADYLLDDLAPLVIYFALFRNNNFVGDPPFNSEYFVQLLRDQISLGKPSMRSSLAWHFWKVLEEKHLPLEDVREYLYMFWTQRYDQNLAGKFELMFDVLVSISPVDACAIFEQMTERLKEFVGEHESLTGDVWIMVGSELIPHFSNYPSRLLKVVNTLVDAWKRGASIYDLASVLESYRFVAAPDREVVKNEFRRLHNEIKELNEKFPEIDWSI